MLSPCFISTLISIDSVLVCVGLFLRAIFNSLVNSIVLLIFIILFCQLSDLAFCRVLLLLLHFLLILFKLGSWLFNLLILLFLLVIFFLFVDWCIFVQEFLGSRFRSNTLFFNIAIFMHLSHWLSYCSGLILSLMLLNVLRGDNDLRCLNSLNGL